MDTSENTIVVATLLPGEEVPVIDPLSTHPPTGQAATAPLRNPVLGIIRRPAQRVHTPKRPRRESRVLKPMTRRQER